jgi:hypothetical protein
MKNNHDLMRNDVQYRVYYSYSPYTRNITAKNVDHVFMCPSLDQKTWLEHFILPCKFQIVRILKFKLSQKGS